MQLVGNVKGGENCDFPRINRQRAGRNLAHALIDVLGQTLQVFRIAVRPDGISLIVDFDLNGWGSGPGGVSVQVVLYFSAHPRIASAISGSAAAIASSILCTLTLMASRSASRRSIWATNSCLSPPRLRTVASCRSRSSFSCRRVLVS